MALLAVVVIQPGVAPSDAPVVEPGTPVVTTLHRAGETAYVRVAVPEGEALPVTVEVPDRAPDREVASEAVRVRLIAPDGAEDVAAPVPDGPIAEGRRVVGEGAVPAGDGGTWTVEVSASTPVRVLVQLGAADPVPQDDPALADWYATEPGSQAGAVTTTSLARPTGAVDRPAGLAGTTAGGYTLMIILTLPIVAISVIALRPWRYVARYRDRRRTS